MEIDVAVIGAGPAGIGAGRALLKKKKLRWAIFEKAGHVGGLASSRIDENGFTWDLGGHVIFSRNAEFNALVENTLGEEALYRQRAAFIRMAGRYIPFPLQNNIHRLPAKMMNDCWRGMQSAGKSGLQPANFYEWIVARLGQGLADHFMHPYNRKVWDYPLEKMDYGWIDDRVSLPDLKQVASAMKSKKDFTGWGPNAQFVFPEHGGTGGLFTKLADPLGNNLYLKNGAVSVNSTKKELTLKDGTVVSYKRLINTMPLNVFVGKVVADAPVEVKLAAKSLVKNSGWMVGIGLRREIKTERCWCYFPETNSPFYRVTWFHNYAPSNTPRAGMSSLLCEVSTGTFRKLKADDVYSAVLNGLVTSGIITKADLGRVATLWKERLPYVYPIPTLGRDTALSVIHGWLAKQGIRSIGRFGGWRYEEGNMDHAFLAGQTAIG